MPQKSTQQRVQRANRRGIAQLARDAANEIPSMRKEARSARTAKPAAAAPAKAARKAVKAAATAPKRAAAKRPSPSARPPRARSKRLRRPRGAGRAPHDGAQGHAADTRESTMPRTASPAGAGEEHRAPPAPRAPSRPARAKRAATPKAAPRQDAGRRGAEALRGTK